MRKGTILARAPDSVAHTLDLGVAPSGYLLVTNFDYWWHDVRAWFDPTSGHLLRPRRMVAAKLLDAAGTLTPAVLNATINADGVLADTVFQAIINVEKDLWLTSKPDPRGSGATGLVEAA